MPFHFLFHQLSDSQVLRDSPDEEDQALDDALYACGRFRTVWSCAPLPNIFLEILPAVFFRVIDRPGRGKSTSQSFNP
jgi:hypothetical protein